MQSIQAEASSARVSPSKFDSGLKSAHSRSNGDSQANSTVIR